MNRLVEKMLIKESILEENISIKNLTNEKSLPTLERLIPEMKGGRKLGMTEALQESKRKMIKVAKSLLKKGLSKSEVAEITELDIKEIKLPIKPLSGKEDF